MTNDNYIESIRTIVDAHHTQYGKFLRKPENKHLLDFIENYESEKLKDNNLQTKIFWILNDIHDYPKCHNPNCPHGGIVKSIYNGTIIENDRTQMEPNNDNKWIENHELDIWLPDIKVAIEYNSTYWHSIPSIVESDKFKKIQCESKGIHLISISEQDWTDDQERCKDLICSKISKYLI